MTRVPLYATLSNTRVYIPFNGTNFTQGGFTFVRNELFFGNSSQTYADRFGILIPNQQHAAYRGDGPYRLRRISLEWRDAEPLHLAMFNIDDPGGYNPSNPGPGRTVLATFNKSPEDYVCDIAVPPLPWRLVIDYRGASASQFWVGGFLDWEPVL